MKTAPYRHSAHIKFMGQRERRSEMAEIAEECKERSDQIFLNCGLYNKKKEWAGIFCCKARFDDIGLNKEILMPVYVGIYKLTIACQRLVYLSGPFQNQE